MGRAKYILPLTNVINGARWTGIAQLTESRTLEIGLFLGSSYPHTHTQCTHAQIHSYHYLESAECLYTLNH